MTDYLPHVATVPFVLGCPEDLPATVPAIEAARPPEGAAVVARLSDPAARTGLRPLLDAVRAARRELGETDSVLIEDDPRESRPNRDNDEAFGIERHRGRALALLLGALLAAFEGVLEVVEEQGTGLDEANWHDLVDGFEVIADWTADPRRVPRPPAVPPPREVTRSSHLDGLRRWVRGHHVFMAFAQGCALAVSSLTAAVEDGDQETAAVAAAVATRMMRASRAALRFAGDATEDQYQEEIRPTLMPPIAPPQMSGLRWRDHEALVRALTDSGPAWSSLAEQHPELLEEFRAALDETYDAHKGVCGHFVGSESPSLLATSRSHRPAVGVLGQFHRMRAGLLPDAGGEEKR
ncbi:hypothetical protein K378_05030 [Streptomyces sp. Amel2xB2]|uniref:hypothetical protein n=1 Tax=Streptomyces sp. Amel2xB2 TaxID=1305829 RepID=UPI000DBA4B34|nr:hypothetical protein [Streptomyces sp. Amel2xB2]RAJ58797.1 hypothetical protein K378_05030 [Streptomyces sp. Amel2xB2]